MYLKEYEKTRLNKLKDIRLLIKPSTEKILKDSFSILITEFKFKIKLLKDISVPNIFFPTSCIEPEISELILIICSQIK